MLPERVSTLSDKLAGGLPSELASIVQAHQRVSKSDATLKAYRNDAVLFQNWSARYRFSPLRFSTVAEPLKEFAGCVLHCQHACC